MPGVQDTSLAASPKQVEAAALAADGPEGRKLSDRIIRARQWAAERRRITEERSTMEGPEATARAQTQGSAGDVRDIDLPVKGPDPSTHEESERQDVAPVSEIATVEVKRRGQGGPDEPVAERREVGKGKSGGAVAAEDDVLDLDAEEAAAAASRTTEAWQAEDVFLTIG